MSLKKGLVLDLDISSEGLQGTTKFKDKTPYENNGTLSNVTLTTDHKGKANSAGLFNGTSSYIDCGNGSSLNISSTFSFSAWINITNAGAYDRIYTNKSSNTYPFTIGIFGTKLAFSDKNNVDSIRTVSQLTVGKWTHICVISTGSQSTAKFFIDGVLISQEITTGFTFSNITNIGSRNGVSNFFDGSIERPQIWNRALSADEVKLLYESYNPCLKMTRALKGTFIDSRDGTEYKTIKIGNQTWMAENLKYLPSVSPSNVGSGTDPYYYVYDYQGTDVATAKTKTNFQTYGVLYNWTAATTACPAGWHLPSDEEFKTLEKYLGMTEAEADLTDWRYSGDVGTKLKSGGSSGFNALMSGLRTTGGSFGDMGSDTYFWSSTGSGSSAWRRYLRTSFSPVNRYTRSKAYGFSVRCIRDY